MHLPRAHIYDQEQGRWLAFSNPAAVLQAGTLADVLPALAEADRLVREKRLWAAGWLAYEAAPAFDPAMRTQPPAGGLPLLWIGLFSEPAQADLPPQAGPGPAPAWAPSQDEAAYRGVIAAIKEYIARGDTYQVNYTLRMRADFVGEPWDLFRVLVQAQQGGPAAYLHTGTHAICSASPELFFTLDGDRLHSRPMKGTQRRGLSAAEDRANAAWLAASEKNRAENVMIVDMVRNDMGRIAATGSVHVPALFAVERYPTVLQMTSTVACRTDASVPEIFAALFPCASITGAPKIRTMEIIAALEGGPRGVYTGAIGFWGPGRRAQFNVAIRTAVIDLAGGRAEYGAGGGIVWDSEAGDEYRECLLKTRVLADRRPAFDLLETMRWSPAEGFFLLERHMERLSGSAEYFGYALDAEAVRTALREAASGWPPGTRRVRLLLSEDGGCRVESSAIEADLRPHEALLRPEPGAAVCAGALAPSQIDRADVWLYHKTTHRGVYEAARAAHPGACQVLLWNEAGEATEFTAANLVARFGGAYVTPPVSSGLLAGVLRSELLARGVVAERVIRLEELGEAEGVWAVNSVWGWVDVRMGG